MKVSAVIAAVALLFIGRAADAQPTGASAESVSAIANCRSQSRDEDRLRCYDKAAAALDEAIKSGTVVLVDRDTMKKTRRSLFGLSLPYLPFFGGDDEKEPQEAKEITAKVKFAQPAGYEMWLLELETGAFWQTTEATPSLMMPRPGTQITIRKSVAGGYMLHMGQRRIRARRVR